MEGLTPACIDMLKRILVADPAQRICMQDLQRHEWFLAALPQGADRMNDVFLANAGPSRLPMSDIMVFGQLVLKVLGRKDAVGDHVGPAAQRLFLPHPTPLLPHLFSTIQTLQTEVVVLSGRQRPTV